MKIKQLLRYGPEDLKVGDCFCHELDMQSERVFKVVDHVSKGSIMNQLAATHGICIAYEDGVLSEPVSPGLESPYYFAPAEATFFKVIFHDEKDLIDLSLWPKTCRACGKPAYQGYTEIVTCSNKTCSANTFWDVKD